MEKQRTTIESVLCRIEAKEINAAADKFLGLHEALLDSMKTQFLISAGQQATSKKEVISLREFGMIITRIGLAAVAASEDEEAEEKEDKDEL